MRDQGGGRGLCQVRENRFGTLFSLVYGRTISRHVDPIEKKPLYHFYPGSLSFSIATSGCNMRCRWCQNWEISQQPRDQHLIGGYDMCPEEIISAAQRGGCRSVAYTYTEPTIFFEYGYDTARLARAAGMANVYVSNGYMTAEMLRIFHPWLDAVNIDLKAFSDETYRQYAGARLQPVLDSLKRIRDYGIWLEVTTLVIPGINDEPEELQNIAEFIAHELGETTPWHVSRFFPQYRLDRLAPTPDTTMEQADRIGRAAGLKYVYLGNMGGRNDTVCPECAALLICRSSLNTVTHRIVDDGCCPECGTAIPGIGL